MGKVRVYQKRPGSVMKNKDRGRWQTVVRYQEADAEVAAGRSYGDPALGPKRQRRHLLSQKCRSRDNRGREFAMEEAAEWHRRLVEEGRAALAGDDVDGDDMTVGECLAHYLDVRDRAGDLEPSTISRYRERAAAVDGDGVAAIPISELTMQDVEGLRDRLRARYSAYTTRDVLALVKSALARAVTEGRIAHSPAEGVGVSVPRGEEPAYLPDAECERLVRDLRSQKGARRTPSVLGTLMALLTGMREEEICGLTYRDVDEDAGVLRVRRAVGRDRDGRGPDGKRRCAFYLKGPKSPSSRRDIPMSDEARAIVAECRAAAEGAGMPVDGDCFVFGKGRDFLNPKVIYRNFARRAERLGLVDSKGGTPTFHSLRHTFATRAIRAGVDVRSVASILGHSDVSVTLNFYAASDPDACRRAMETVSRGFADAA